MYTKVDCIKWDELAKCSDQVQKNVQKNMNRIDRRKNNTLLKKGESNVPSQHTGTSSKHLLSE